MSHVIRIATRKSELAMWQAQYVRERLQQVHPQLKVELVPLSTQGDVVLDQSLSKIGGKGLFVKELEQALLDHRADIAVHSFKDMPMELPESLCVAAVLTREDARDALVSEKFNSLDELPKNALVGTSSLRRQSQIKNLRSDIQTIDLRGNVNTRIKKLHDGHYDAIVLAAAGLIRLGMTGSIRHYFSPEQILPAAAQGAIAIEACCDEKIVSLLSELHDVQTAACVTAERVVNRLLGGSCQVPIAAYARINNGQLVLDARVCDLSGAIILHASGVANVSDAQQLGEHVTQQLIAQGARELLQKILSMEC